MLKVAGKASEHWYLLSVLAALLEDSLCNHNVISGAQRAPPITLLLITPTHLTCSYIIKHAYSMRVFVNPAFIYRLWFQAMGFLKR